MAGKVSDEDMFRLEKRIKKAETIIACMTEEERTVPDLLARQVSTNINMHALSLHNSAFYRVIVFCTRQNLL